MRNGFFFSRFKNDTVVVPRDSAWFYEAADNEGSVMPVKETALYKEDWIGLRALDKDGRVAWEEADGNHMEIDKEHFVKLIKKYLVDAKEEGSSTLLRGQGLMQSVA